jgi:hypothetical protein
MMSIVVEKRQKDGIVFAGDIPVRIVRAPFDICLNARSTCAFASLRVRHPFKGGNERGSADCAGLRQLRQRSR